jgi:hypothetical protein
MSRYISFIKLKHLIFINEESSKNIDFTWKREKRVVYTGVKPFYFFKMEKKVKELNPFTSKKNRLRSRQKVSPLQKYKGRKWNLTNS